jgi:hypothetical protein
MPQLRPCRTAALCRQGEHHHPTRHHHEAHNSETMEADAAAGRAQGTSPCRRMKSCEVCGATFKPSSRRSQYCRKLCAARAANARAAALTRKRILRDTLVRHGLSGRLYRFSVAEEQTICDEYERGDSTPGIARRHNTSRQMVKDILARNMVPLRSRAESMQLYVRRGGQRDQCAYQPPARSPVNVRTQQPASAYVALPALAPGTCAGCNVAVGANERVCDACSLAGL